MTIFDEIAAAMADAKPVLESAFLGIDDGVATGDGYQLLRSITTYDRFRNPISTTDTVVESGGCTLQESTGRGIDRLGNEVGAGLANYTVLLPLETAAQHHDRIRIATRATGEIRTFEIAGPPLRGGSFSVFTRCDLQLIVSATSG